MHSNINLRMNGSLGPLFLSMKSTSSSDCLTSVSETWSCSADRTKSLPFDTKQSTIMNILFANIVRKLLAVLPTCSPKSIMGRLLTLPFCFPHLSNFAHTCSPTHLNRLQANLFSTIEIMQEQAVLECYQNVRNCCLTMQGSIPNLLQTIQPPDNGPMLLLQNLGHPFFLPLVKCTIVGLPHLFGKWIHGEFCLLQADWWFALCTAQVEGIISLVIWIIIVVGNHQQWGHMHNPCDICVLRFLCRLHSFCWEANWRSSSSGRRKSTWRIRARRY